MPLNCKKCGWSQDHFWNKNYNPITFLEKTYKRILLTVDLDGPTTDVTWRKVIAGALECSATKVRNMRFRTRAELEGLDPSEVVCPSCSLVGLEMD